MSTAQSRVSECVILTASALLASSIAFALVWLTSSRDVLVVVQIAIMSLPGCLAAWLPGCLSMVMILRTCMAP